MGSQYPGFNHHDGKGSYPYANAGDVRYAAQGYRYDEGSTSNRIHGQGQQQPHVVGLCPPPNLPPPPPPPRPMAPTIMGHPQYQMQQQYAHQQYYQMAPQQQQQQQGQQFYPSSNCWNAHLTSITASLPIHPPPPPPPPPKKEKYKCEPCELEFESHVALESHIKSHTKCSECSFSASPKVVKAHYQSKHGKFSSRGFQTITVAIPGCPVQRFRICVGNHPEDVKRWIADRKKKFPRQRKPPPTLPTTNTKSTGLNSLLDGYGSSSSSDNDDDNEKKESKTGNDNNNEDTTSNNPPPTKRRAICRYFARHGTCRNGDACKFSHQLAERQQTSPLWINKPLHKKQPKRPLTLLRKLLQKDMERENIMSLQLIQYIVQQNYFKQDKTK